MEGKWSALVVDDDVGVRQSLRLCLEADGARVLGVGTGEAALNALQINRFDVVFLDLWLGTESGLAILPDMLRCQPGIGIIVITAFATFETAVEAMRLGAADYLPKPFTPEQVRRAAGRVVAAGVLRQEHEQLRRRIDAAASAHVFDSQSPAYRMFLDIAARAAGSESVVLLRGESGTGKNILAQWMHARSRRSAGPFVTVHCPSLAGDLMTSALFGHRRGAFTGALSDAAGKVDEAQGGTLFLDEIGDLTADAQARLLRFLNDRTYERLGEAKDRQADVRIIAATNRALEEEVRNGRLREDLFFRLNVITLALPSLRDRAEDVLPLALHYLRFFERSHGRQCLTLSPSAERAICTSPWLGNLRELRNALERAVTLEPGLVIEPSALGLQPLPDSSDPAGSGNPSKRLGRLTLGDEATLDDIERDHIARLVAKVPTLDAAAKILGIDPTTLQRKRKRYGLV